MKCFRNNLVYLIVQKIIADFFFLFSMLLYFDIFISVWQKILSYFGNYAIQHNIKLCIQNIIIDRKAENSVFGNLDHLLCIFILSQLRWFQRIFLCKIIIEANRSSAFEFLFGLLLSNEFYCTAGVKSYLLFSNRV